MRRRKAKCNSILSSKAGAHFVIYDACCCFLFTRFAVFALSRASICSLRCTVVQRGFCQDVVTIGHSSFSHFFRRSNAKVLILPAAHVPFLRSDIYLSPICTWNLRVAVVTLRPSTYTGRRLVASRRLLTTQHTCTQRL